MKKNDIVWVKAVEQSYEYYSVKSKWLMSLMKMWAAEDMRKPSDGKPHDIVEETRKLVEKVLHNEYEPDVMKLIQSMAMAEDAIQGIYIALPQAPPVDFSLRKEIQKMSRANHIPATASEISTMIEAITGKEEFIEFVSGYIQEELQALVRQKEMELDETQNRQ